MARNPKGVVVPKSPPGQPTKLTPARQEKLVVLRRQLLPMSRCAWAVGISPRTVENWLRAGQYETVGPYVAFFAAWEKATAEGIAERLRIIQAEAKDGAWQAAAWQLERLFPDEFALRAKDDPKAMLILVERVVDRLVMLVPDVASQLKLADALDQHAALLEAKPA